MANDRGVTAPDGDRWRVRRRWLDRSLPDLWGRFRRNQEWLADRAPEDGGGVLDLAFDNVLLAIVLLVAAAFLVLVLLPLLGVALELVFILFLFFSGIAGRIFLRRPWKIEVENLDHPERSRSIQVKGWRASNEAVDSISREIAAGA